MPRKIRQLITGTCRQRFTEIPGGSKGSHRKFTHHNFSGAVTVSGKDGDDAKPYQERQIQRAIDEVQNEGQ